MQQDLVAGFISEMLNDFFFTLTEKKKEENHKEWVIPLSHWIH